MKNKHQFPTYVLNKKSLSLKFALALLIPGFWQIYKRKLLTGILWFIFVILGYTASFIITPGNSLEVLLPFCAIVRNEMFTSIFLKYSWLIVDFCPMLPVIGIIIHIICVIYTFLEFSESNEQEQKQTFPTYVLKKF